MQPFVVNRHGRLVFPSNFQPDLDFSVIETEEQLDGVIRRDFETKAPTGTDIMSRVEAGGYPSRYELMRDVALNLFWVNRFALTMYDKYPVRWRDVTRTRQDMFLPIVAPWHDRDAKVEAVRRGYAELPATWNSISEDRIFAELFDVFGHRTFDATKLPSIKPTIAEALADPTGLTFVLTDYDPTHVFHTYEDIVDVTEEVPELEALQRWSMVLHNQYPWDLSTVRLTAVGDLQRRRCDHPVRAAVARRAAVHPEGEGRKLPWLPVAPPQWIGPGPRPGRRSSPPNRSGPTRHLTWASGLTFNPKLRPWRWSRANMCAAMMISSATPPTAGHR